MSNKGLYFYKLVSDYPEDQTVNCKLSINQIDSNFETLKDADIKTAEFAREEKILVLTRNDGEKFIVPLNDVVFNLDVSSEVNEDGTISLMISYDGEDGEQTITIDNIITTNSIEGILGDKVLTKVITDGTLRGDGTMHHPLGLNGVYKTGSLAPARSIIDLTEGESLPEIGALGARYITKENVNDYGYLYNVSGLEKISSRIENGWRIPSKSDWDVLLNSLEPCEYQNHNSNACHVELGLNAGAFLKSECGWNGQRPCSCGMNESNGNDTANNESYDGIDKFGMNILPAGDGNIDSLSRIITANFGEESHFWTTSHVYDDPNQDIYVKGFIWNMGGVEQTAECENRYFSVRLVKDYDGSNYFDNEYIDGVIYKTVLFPETKQIWLASNYANKEGFIVEGEGEVPEVIDVNGGLVNENRKEYFINEWNGNYWDKKPINKGETIVIENPPFVSGETIYREVCWIDEHGEQQCITIEIPSVEQSNLEYRAYTDENCDKVLYNTDDLVTERVIDALAPVIGKEIKKQEEFDNEITAALEAERNERISTDTEILNVLNEEISARTSVDNEIWHTLNEEISARTNADNIISNALHEEISARTNADVILTESINNEKSRAEGAEAELLATINSESSRAQGIENQIIADLDDEIIRAKAKEDEIDGQLLECGVTYEFSAIVDPSSHNLTIKSKDNNPEHFINVDFSGDFGEI